MGDYTIFVQYWDQPKGGIHEYLTRFVASGDSTFQHIAIWTLLQLLESEDQRLIGFIAQSKEIVGVIDDIGKRTVESDDEEGDAADGEGEVVGLARKCLTLLGRNPKEGKVGSESSQRSGRMTFRSEGDAAPQGPRSSS